MLFDPTERNVNPCLIETRARAMKELVLALAIHDKDVTMAETAQVSLIIRTGPTPPSEDCGGTMTHRNDELGITELSKQRFVISVPTHTRVPSPVKVQVRGGTPSAHQGFIRGAMALHTPASSGKHRFPECGPTAGPCPYEYEQVHKESQGPPTLCGTTPSLPSLQLRQGEKKDSPLWRAPRKIHTPDRSVSSSSVQPCMFLIILPGPGASGE